MAQLHATCASWLVFRQACGAAGVVIYAEVPQVAEGCPSHGEGPVALWQLHGPKVLDGTLWGPFAQAKRAIWDSAAIPEWASPA